MYKGVLNASGELARLHINSISASRFLFVLIWPDLFRDLFAGSKD